MKMQPIQLLFVFTIFTTVLKQSEAIVGAIIAIVAVTAATTAGLLCLSSIICTRRTNDHENGPPPDTTPPQYYGDFAVCNKKASAINFGKRVGVRPIKKFWEKPKAKDDSNPVNVEEPFLPGEFGQGRHEYVYYATDSARSRNMNICKVQFFVEVKTCSILAHPNNGYHDCPRIANYMLVGTICRYSCKEGYKLKGSSQLECKGTPRAVSWTPQPAPICTKITCDPLSDPMHGLVTCRKGYDYFSICIYSCDDGYGLDRGVVSSLICLYNGWSGPPVEECTDNESPAFSGCESQPLVYRFSIAANESASVFNWTIPVATDDDGIALNTTEPGFPKPGIDELSANFYSLLYLVTDDSGNVGTCSVLLIVSEIRCESLPFQVGLHASCSHGSRRGSFCHFTCSDGYYLVGNNHAMCERTNSVSMRGEWSNLNTQCKEVHCDPAPALENGHFTNGFCETKHLSVCGYKCSEGYKIRNSVRYCAVQPGTNITTWVGDEPVCEAQTCYRPPLYGILGVSNGTLCASTPYVPASETCSFGCAEGYVLKGAEVTQCGRDGSWLQPIPECEAIACSLIPQPRNGGINGCPFQSKVRYGSICTLFCNVGFKPINESDPVQRACGKDEHDRGYWKGGGTITCAVVTCIPLSGPVNGEIISCSKDGSSTNISHIQHYNTICKSSCNPGYTPQYSITRRCMEDGSWDGIDQLCQDETNPRVTCPSDQNLYADYNQVEATFQADLWEPVQATDAGDILTAYLHSVDSYIVNGSIPTTLPEGEHTINYRATDTNGNWDSCSFTLDVKVTRCPPLFIPRNGELTMGSGSGSCTGGAIYGSECMVSCLDGHVLSEDPEDDSFFSLVCNRSNSPSTVGSWSGSIPSCNKIECDIPSVSNGSVSGCPISALYGDSCYFSCNDGFKTSEGLKSITKVCQDNGTFDGQDLHCDVQVTCPSLIEPENGFVTPDVCTGPGGVLYNTLCSFSCDDGYLQNGVYQKTCLRTGLWNDMREVTCTDNEAPVFSPPCPMNHYYNADRGYTYASLHEISDLEPVASDNSGVFNLTLKSMIPIEYKFPETPTRLTYNAIDSEGNLAVCDVIVHVTVFRCPRLQAPSHGSLVNCSVSPVYGSQCSFSCNEGYDLVGSETRACELRGDYGPASWTGTEPVCQAKTCPALITPENAVKSGCINNPPNTEVYGTQCIFYCLYGFEGIGDSSPVCQADGTWTSNSFNCSATSCSLLVVPDGGSVSPEECSMAPVFGQSCVVSCAQQGYQLDPPNFSVLSCQGNGQWAPGDLMMTTCKDIQSPSFSSCPQYLTFNPPRGDTLVNVFWNVSAMDNSGEEPIIACNKEQGLTGEGDFEVRCTATDATGNGKTCTFDGAVQVHRCRPYLLPSFAEFAGVCDTIWGTECNITCNPGYHLTGSSMVTCEFDGSTTSWTAQTTPRCEALQCDPLDFPEHININPSLCAGQVGVSVGTRCTPYCPTGTDLQGDGSTIVCGSDGRWNRFINGSTEDLACLDITAPILTSCPSPITVTQTEAWGVHMSFNPPTATDSLDGSSLIVTTSPSDLTSPYNLTQDTTFIYTFSDNAGNQVNCSFPIYVRDELSPVLVSCPNDTEVSTSQLETEVTWDPPEFFEPTGDPLDISCNYENGKATLAVNKDHLIECRATNQDNAKTTTCSFIRSVKSIPCQDLDPPKNGALTCDGWSDGKFCSMFCSENFDIPNTKLNIPQQYVCGLSGMWSPHNTIPDCTESRRGKRINLPSEIFYFSGTCGTNETQLEIASAFLEAFQSSGFGGSCTKDDECTVNNVQVTCGPTSRRRRRRRRRQMDIPVDLGIWEEHLYFRHPSSKIHKRSALDFEIVVGFNIETNLIVAEGQKDYDAALDAEQKMIGLVEILIEDGQLDLSSRVDDFTAVLDESSFNHEYVELMCTPPYTANNDVYRCVPCGRGFYYDNDTQECIQCEIGTYQDTHGEFTCHQCPEGQSTIAVGSKNVTQCIDICQPGYSSSTGLAPCNHCPIGTFQELFFATECTSCPVGTTTLNKGSTSSLECIEFCAAGEYSSSGFGPCMACPLGTYQSGTQRNTCHQCPGDTTTLQTGSTKASMCVDMDECESQPCQHDASCLDGISSFTCICALGYTGSTCGDQILWCDSDPCLNRGSCVNEVAQFTCMCAPGYTGSICETEIDYCDPTPCKNDATCKNSQGHFECFCPFGFGGETCSKEIDYCVDTPCQNSASCVMSERSASGYICICTEGYTGVNCSSNIDDCKSSPCLNDGNCTDGINSFTCSCTAGFNGFICDEDIDLCADWNCQNGGTCKDLGNRAVCACHEAYAGQFCDEVRTACSDSPCRNGGTCTAVDDTTLAFTCTCTEGYIGQTCETKVNFCQPDPCRNGATCMDQATTYSCHCPDGFMGETCAQDISWCDDNPCGPNSTCIEEPLSFRCLCDVGYTGERCEEVLTICDAQDPCLNGATCSGDSLTFQCECPPAYQGLLCEHEINPCATSPCLNGGTCVKDLQSYQCECTAGFEGIRCEVDQDECASEPCEHGACIDGINSFSCDCEAGYTGHTCSEDMFCDAHPCQNGGSCENLNTRYRCRCALGFQGRRCIRHIDYCRQKPCTSGNTVRCEDEIGGYTCMCKEGFTGLDCESEINECEMSPSPCQHDGRCINQWGTFTCQCRVGFNGNRCEINIDDCVSHGCENGASCVDGINSYICLCNEGTYGSRCQLKSTPCDNNPCYNGGVCTVNRDGISCECLSGFTGPTCEVDIDDCVNHRCASGSTCEDQWDSYRCICPLGVTGDLCGQEIDDCLSDPCQHGATCIDGRSRYTCACSSGFTGNFCEVDLLECSSNPCVNFGTCIEGTDRFDCQCAEGYRGKNCEELTRSCVSSPCKNNGTCTDGFMHFICTCHPGFKGDECESVIPDNYDLKLVPEISSIVFSADVSTKLQNVTVSLWVKADMTSSDKQLIHFGMGNLQFGINNPCSLFFQEAGQIYSSTGHTLCDGRWHHVLLLFINTGRWSVLLDGSEIMSEDGDASQYNLSGNLQLEVGADEFAQNDSIYMTGVNVWSGHVSDDVLSRVTSECLPQLYGNIISWTDFDSHQAFPTTSLTPSICDDIDECQSLTPCQNGGTCVDKLRSYTCLCFEDYVGINCEKFIDLCNSESCENGGSCVTTNRTIHCSCPDRFFGEFCELEIIDGSWSNWLPWSPCSVSCGGGTRNTSRECTNPAPNDYGLPCHGEKTKQEPCNIQDCPGCLHLQSPENATLNCWSEGETKKCTVSCNSPDLGFVQPILPEYSCGLESDYKWDHENDYNRRASLPPCVETKSPESLQMQVNFAYPGATCASEADEESLKELVSSNIINNVHASGCIDCALSNVQVNNCDLSKKRSVEESPITFSFDMDFSNVTMETSFSEFSNRFDQRLENGSFSLEVNGEVIAVDTNQSSGEAKISCPRGSGLTVQGSCVVCPIGTFQYLLPNTSTALCAPCLLHTYQDQEGQVECLPCPSGLITTDPGADDINHCIEPCPLGHYQDVWSDPSNTTCVQCPLGTYQNEIGIESCFPCPTGYVTLEPGAASASDCVAVCNAGHYVDLLNETNPQCPPCPLHTFLALDVHQEQECIPCAPGMITIQNGSSHSTHCLVVCQQGTYLESSSCTPCSLNTYQDQTNHREESCILCPGNLITFDESSDNLANCTEPDTDKRPNALGTTLGQILGIVSGTVVLIIICLVVVGFCRRKRQRRCAKKDIVVDPKSQLEMKEMEQLLSS